MPLLHLLYRGLTFLTDLVFTHRNRALRRCAPLGQIFPLFRLSPPSRPPGSSLYSSYLPRLIRCLYIKKKKRTGTAFRCDPLSQLTGSRRCIGAPKSKSNPPAMESLNSLASSLPTPHQKAEQELLNNFKCMSLSSNVYFF